MFTQTKLGINILHFQMQANLLVVEKMQVAAQIKEKDATT